MRNPPSLNILALLLLGALPAPAVPLNDAFANRISLGSAPAATASGETTGATLQSNENDLDAVGGASLWWKWTAPENAWVSVDTKGSAIDTVLAVLADGPALRDTYVVGCNDESGDPDAGDGSSRVIFEAAAGTEYHIAVHGFLAVQGQVQLHLQSGISPPLRLTSLTLAPGSVNVTTASQTVMADIGVSSVAAFAEGALVLHRANFAGITEIPLSPAQRISGTATEGIYRVSVPVPRYSAPGTWLLEAAITDTTGREAVFGRGVSASFEYDHVFPDSLTGLLSVANTGAVDGVEPALASFSISPGAVSTTLNPAALVCQFRMTDALSGFGSAILTLYTPSGTALTALPVLASHRILGTALDGTYQIPFTLPAKMPGGIWEATLLLRDAAGNPALFDGALNGAAFPAGSTGGSITVTGVAHGYWASIYPLTTATPAAQPGGDLDHDGIANLLEYAFGMALDAPGPFSSGTVSGLPVFEKSPAGLTLTYFRRPSPALGLQYIPQFSTDFSTWQNVSGGTVVQLPGGLGKVTLAAPASAASTQYSRVQVNLAD